VPATLRVAQSLDLSFGCLSAFTALSYLIPVSSYESVFTSTEIATLSRFMCEAMYMSVLERAYPVDSEVYFLEFRLCNAIAHYCASPRFRGEFLKHNLLQLMQQVLAKEFENEHQFRLVQQYGLLVFWRLALPELHAAKERQLHSGR
jgi:hypothetical protein